MKQVTGLGTLAAALCGLSLTGIHAAAGELAVLSTTPAPRTLDAAVDTSIVVNFDRPVEAATLVARRSFWAFGRWSGAVDGTFQLSDGNSTVTLLPARPLSAGEQVMVILSHDIEAADGSNLRSAGYSFQFWTATEPADMDFEQIAEMTTRTRPSASTRVYGGFATDLDRDGFLDITTVNEDSADLRVFMNQADGSGLFDHFLRPTFPVNDRCSPSEPSDLNADGIADACVANINTDTVSILLGVGDGTFGLQQQIAVGTAPRGIAILDVDGDGDMDIVNTNSGSSNLSLLINDGTGNFGSPTFFDGGGSGEWALAAADMNGDNVLDLVIGARSSQEILIHTGDGDATFTHVSTQSSGGAVWMLVCGDVNGDGNEDIATANSSNNTASILLGDGTGSLGSPQTVVSDPFPLATDLGDLDGDGDLDWVISSFGGDWWLYANNGNGGFTHTQTFPAPVASSDALLMDIDNDGDLDLGLMDEIADVVIIFKNSGTAFQIPTLSDWSLIAMALLILTAGTVVFRSRQVARASE